MHICGVGCQTMEGEGKTGLRGKGAKGTDIPSVAKNVRSNKLCLPQRGFVKSRQAHSSGCDFPQHVRGGCVWVEEGVGVRDMPVPPSILNFNFSEKVCHTERFSGAGTLIAAVWVSTTWTGCV